MIEQRVKPLFSFGVGSIMGEYTFGNCRKDCVKIYGNPK